MDRRTFLAAFGGSLAAALMQLEHAAVAGRSEGQRRSALRLLGHAHQEAGESAFDRLDLGAAADHLRQAHEIGAELGDADMIANALRNCAVGGVTALWEPDGADPPVWMVSWDRIVEALPPLGWPDARREEL
jgi:hypothetical protein